MKTINLHTILKTESFPYSEIPEKWNFNNLQDEFHIEDLMGDAPQDYDKHEGSLEVEGNIRIENDDSDYGYLVINGDLSSKGVIQISVADAYCPIIVTGNLTAKHLILQWEAHLYVLGKAQISGALVNGLTDSGYALLKNCEAKAMIENDYGEIDFDGKEIDTAEMEAFPDLEAFWKSNNL